MDNKILAFLPKIYFPNAVFCGDKSLLYLKTIQNVKKLVVVSGSFKKLNSELLNDLFGEKIEYFIQDGEPTFNDFNKLKEACAKNSFDYLIAMGGGSVIDLVKLVKQELGVKMAAVPTTIGSGAEVSQHALLLDNGRKKIKSSPQLLPETVLINPACLKSLSREQIVIGSIDALAHGLESLASKISNSFSDHFALKAIESIYYNLDKLASGEEEDEIIVELQTAAILAGLAQSSAATGLVHSFAHYFGAKNKINHAKAVAIFLVDVLELNFEHTDKYQKLNRLKDLSSNNFIDKIKKLFDRLDIRQEKINLQNELEETAELIKKDICTLTNPYFPAVEDIIKIIKKHINE